MKKKNNDFTMKKLVKDFNVAEPKTLWETWTLKQKFIWVWKNKLNFGEKQKILYNQTISKYLYDEDSYEEFKNRYYKYWFEDKPKMVTIIDVFFTPVAPLEYVECKFNLSKK